MKTRNDNPTHLPVTCCSGAEIAEPLVDTREVVARDIINEKYTRAFLGLCALWTHSVKEVLLYNSSNMAKYHAIQLANYAGHSIPRDSLNTLVNSSLVIQRKEL